MGVFHLHKKGFYSIGTNGGRGRIRRVVPPFEIEERLDVVERLVGVKRLEHEHTSLTTVLE